MKTTLPSVLPRCVGGLEFCLGTGTQRAELWRCSSMGRRRLSRYNQRTMAFAPYIKGSPLTAVQNVRFRLHDPNNKVPYRFVSTLKAKAAHEKAETHVRFREVARAE